MRSEDLFISSETVRVKYRFVNRSKNPIKTIVAFPIPDITSKDENPREANRKSFQTLVNGEKVGVDIERKIFIGNKDVTATLAKFGVSADSPADTLNEIPEGAWNELSKSGIKKSFDPSWRVSTSYYWEQTFPPGVETVIEHSYSPSRGGMVGRRAKWSNKALLTREFLRYRKKYCLEDSVVRSLQKQARHEMWISYILSTGANWAGPIHDFRLVVDKEHPDYLVSFCAEGIKKISPTQFEVRRKNFVPKDDLHVVIFHAPSAD